MQAALDEAIYNKLNTTSGVTSLLSSATAIYAGIAPSGTEPPYIVYTIAGGGSENESPLDSADLTYYIKAVTGSASTAAALADAIRAALHEPSSMVIDAPWTIIRCQHTVNIFFQETTERDQYWHGGGAYRIRLSE
jgi:hypothetical protein